MCYNKAGVPCMKVEDFIPYYNKLVNGNTTRENIMQELNICSATFYKYKREAFNLLNKLRQSTNKTIFDIANEGYEKKMQGYYIKKCQICGKQDVNVIYYNDCHSNLCMQCRQDYCGLSDLDNKNNDPINHPNHYTRGKIEVIDYIEDQQLGYHLGNAIKYISRAGFKDSNEVQDLKKAIWFIERKIKLVMESGTKS